MTDLYDVAVIGAGVVGAMIARELTKYNLKVCILERENDVACGATKANSAIVHAGFDAKEGSLKARLNVRGSKMMAETAKQLGVRYKNNGSLVIALNDDDMTEVENLYNRGVKNGVDGLKIIDAKELKLLEPNITDNAVGALYAPTGAIICPYGLCIAAVGNAMDNGAELKLNFEVGSISHTDGAYRLASDKDSICAKYVVNAAGVYADRIANMAGDFSFKIHPRRGEYILLDSECGTLTERTIFRTPSKKGKGILLSPTVDGNYLTGPTAVDMKDKEDKSTTPEGYAKIISEAMENVPSVSFAKTITSFCGLRAVGDTGDFIINVKDGGFVNVAAIESPGLSASPAIAEYVAELLRSSGLKLEINENFNPVREPMHRFRDADIDEKNRIIKQDPRFGRVICRCETVTEGEIVEAIYKNPGARDIDGVKRRTRSGMGRCQGGFCLPYVAEILSRELGKKYDDITKSGGNSHITVGKTKGAV